jgi:flavin-dependent dehydrogenase
MNVSSTSYNNLADPVSEHRRGELQGLYDVAVVGGGLAGLSLSIQLARAGYTVVLFEKEKYPFHRVCGEYISLESWNFLEHLGYPLSDMDLPVIKKLIVSSPNGNLIQQDLPLGGFGISRFKIDDEMARLAQLNGVHLLEEKKVTDINFNHTVFNIRCSNLYYQARVVCGAFGKRSNLDIKMKRQFAGKKKGLLNNFIGVKYHIKTDLPIDTIALHNFKNGYCGVSGIEDGKYCLCYLTTAENLRLNNNSIIKLEENVLQKNPFLKKIFQQSKILYQTPLTISQISFESKSQVENHILMVGDAGGMITPLCGNGMSMALHGSKIAASLIISFLSDEITRQQLEDRYVEEWNHLFKRRLAVGRIIQRLFGKEWMTNIFISMMKPFPKFVSFLIRQTHGEPF